MTILYRGELIKYRSELVRRGARLLWYLTNMLCVQDYELHYDSKTNVYTIKVSQSSLCPLCDGELRVRDSRKRGVIDGEGRKRMFRLRRLLCENCDKLHIELPSFIQPFKHYAADVIESVLDGDTVECAAEESTIRRWHVWFAAAATYAERALAAIKLTSLSKSVNLLNYSSLVEQIRAGGVGWLSRLTQMLVCSGGRLVAER